MQIFTFRDYSLRKLTRVKENYKQLSKRHKEMLPDFKPHLKSIAGCIDSNYKFLCNIVNHTGQMFENQNNDEQVTGVP